MQVSAAKEKETYMFIDLITTADLVTPGHIKNSTAIIVDVLRATSVIVTALKNGAKSVVPVISVEEALHTRKKLDNVILGGERKAKKIEGFDLSNSPSEYTHTVVHGKNVIITTTNGTKAITRSSSANQIYIGGLLNAKAVADKAHQVGDNVVIVNAGTDGLFTMDDFIASGAIIKDLMEKGPCELSDLAQTALLTYENYPDLFTFIKKAHHYEILMGLGLEEDIKFCMQKDVYDIVPEYKNGIIKLNKEI